MGSFLYIKRGCIKTKKKIEHIRRRSIGTLVVLLILLCFIFTPALLFGNFDFGSGSEKTTDEEQSLNLSTNYLFQGTTYVFNLDDFYDDEDLYKIYTGAKFQTEAFNGTTLEWTGVVNNDTVTPVDNTETQYGTPSGVYNGTYDFRNDDIGGNPEGFTITETGGTVNVIAEKDGHKKVLEFYDDDPDYHVDATNNFATIQIDSTIEFWWAYNATETLNHYFGMQFKEGTGVRFYLFLNYLWDRLGSIQYRDSTGYHPTGYYDNPINTMIHIKLEFDDTNNEAEFTVNGISYGELPYYSNSTIGIDNIFMFTRTVNGGGPYWHWIDAIGYKSEVYLATYGFDNQPVGTSGLDIDFVDIITGTAEIISEYQGHKKVLNFTHDASNCIINNLPVYQTSGTIEFYLKEVLSRTYFRIQDIGGLLLFEIMSYPTYVKVYYGDGAGGNVYSANYFFTTNFPHFKVSFDCGTDTFSVWCEDFLMVEDVNFKDNEDLTEVYRVRTYNSAASDFYLDAVGCYPWDPDYNIGDNLEGYDPDYTIGENLYPDNINMMNGSYDYTDNMKVNDDSYTTFTSTHTEGYIYETPSQWDNFTFTKGSGGATGELETNNNVDYATIDSSSYVDPTWKYITACTMQQGTQSGTIANAKIDDGNYFTLTSQYIMADTYMITTNNLGFNIAPDGSVQYISYYLWSSSPNVRIKINGGVWKTGNPHLNADNQYHAGVSSVQFQATGTTAFTIRVYYFRMDGIDSVNTELDIGAIWSIPDPIQSLYYDYHTTVSVDCDLDIYNWDTTNWLELQSNTGTGWITGSYGLTDPYISVSNEVKIRFQTGEYAGDFDLELDQLSVSYTEDPAELEMIISFTFARYNEDLLAMTIQSWQKTNISQTITFKIWNYNTESYVQISSSSDTTFTKKEYNTESPNNFISPSGVVKLYWVGSDIINDFELHIDYLFVRIYYKLDLVHSKSFDTNGIYRYRWCVLGSIHYTQWVNFEVVDPVPNFHAVSESDVTTRWILQGSDISAIEDFHDDLSGSNWDLSGVINREIYISSLMEDAYTYSNGPDVAFGYDTKVKVGSFITGHYYYGYLKWEHGYLQDNYTSNSELNLYIYSIQNTPLIDVYNTSTFEQYTITWNNQPALITKLVDNFNPVLDTWNEISVLPYYYYALKHDITASNDVLYLYSSEASSLNLYIEHHLAKNYQGEGLMYMQTNTTELISLKSTDYGSHYTLSSGDYFTVDFQTNSDSQINLILLKDGIVNKTLTLSQSGNTNFNRHTVQVSVDENVEFDQLKVSSTFEDTDNVKVYDIKTKKYTITGDYKDFFVGSKRTEDIYMTPDIYNLRIFEEGTKKIDTNITISGSDYYYVYTPIQTQYCRITLFSVEGNYLNFQDYHVKVNRSLNGEYNQFWLLDTIFYADDETYAYIDIYDRFDSLIDSFERLASDYIDLEIEVYSLQIKNLQTQKTTIDINTTHVYPLLSEESIYFMLSKNYYQIGYYDTNDVYKQFLIYLNSNQAYELNRSKICFLAYINQKGEHLYFDNYKTFINDSLIYENVFYREIGDDIGIEIKDIYGISIKNQTYTVVSGDNYIPVVLTLYSLKVMSQQLCFNHINITRDPNYYESEYYWSEWIAPSEIIEFKLFAGYYKINLTNNEAGSYSSYSYTLSGDDILLIGSNNTIYNVLVNIANVNATIGNQITNVQIDLTNQNSNINNTIINIEINLDNLNSTLGSLLINIDTAISNINSSIIYEIVSLGTEINNINSSLSNQMLTITTDISNLDSSIQSQFVTLGVDISNINGSIINQILSLGVDITNINTSLSNQILSLEVDISNINALIIEQILLVIADIENIETVIDDQTLVILADITNLNSTLLNQMVYLGVDITNINATIINQILELQVDLTNINSSISNLLTTIDLSIINLQNDIGSFYAFTNNSFINLNNVMNTSFIFMENNIISINQSISNLVIGVSNDVYLINGTISTMITQLETNLLLMNISIDTALFDLGTTLNLLGSNITSNFILLNNSIYLNNLNINDSRIAMINNLLLVNNTISTLISEVYSAVYLINNSIYTAVVDLGTYLSLMNNNIYGNLSIVLEMNEFLTEIYKMTMFSDLLNWTNIGLNTSLITTQIDVWTFINHYINQSVEVHLRYQDLIEKLVISADDFRDQWLPNKDVEYNLWSVVDGKYVDEWKTLDPDNKTVNFGFFEEDVPYDPTPIATTYFTLFIALIFFVIIILGVLKLYYSLKERRTPIPPEVLRYMNKKSKKKIDGVVDNRI